MLFARQLYICRQNTHILGRGQIGFATLHDVDTHKVHKQSVEKGNGGCMAQG